MAHKFVYIVSYTELVNGIVESAGAFEESFKSAKTASCAMLAFPIAYAIHLTITAILGD